MSESGRIYKLKVISQRIQSYIVAIAIQIGNLEQNNLKEVIHIMPVSFESFELKSNEFDVVACMNTSLAKLVLNNMIVNSITKFEGYCHKYCNVIAIIKFVL